MDVASTPRDQSNNPWRNPWVIGWLGLVVVVLLAFFGFRNALFVGLAIPFSMLITFIVLRALAQTFGVPEESGSWNSLSSL